jgi:hypothetical protein
MTYRTFLLCVALLGFALTGCQAHNDFQKKWPRYPHWEWWKHPAKGVPEPAEEKTTNESQEGIEKKDMDSPEEKTESREPATLEEHRINVWEKVAVLRDVDELPPPQQRKLVESARRNLRKWYRPMTVAPPDPDDPQWITVLVWDFMPEEDFEQAAENWRQTARRDNLPFPEDVTRRQLMELIGKITSGELNSAAKTQPATSPAAGKSTPPAK